ncbi:MAG: PEP-CTERM sorting domain-containing protein [Thermoguttaceae bacterium]
MRKLLARILLHAIAILVMGIQITTSKAASTIVFDDLGPDDSYGNGGNWFGRSTFDFSYNPIATDFIPVGSGKVDELWLAMFSYGGPNEVTLSILSNLSGYNQTGAYPGNVIWQQTFTNQLGYHSGSILHLTDLDGPFLTAGTTYWLMASTPDTIGSQKAWWENNQDDEGVGIFAWKEQNGSNPRSDWNIWYNGKDYRRALRVGVVPEPCTFILLCIGFISILTFARRKR